MSQRSSSTGANSNINSSNSDPWPESVLNPVEQGALKTVISSEEVDDVITSAPLSSSITDSAPSGTGASDSETVLQIAAATETDHTQPVLCHCGGYTCTHDDCADCLEWCVICLQCCGVSSVAL